MSARDDLRAVMTAEWRRPAELHRDVGLWSPYTIRHELNKLLNDGIAEHDQAPIGCRRYRVTEGARTAGGRTGTEGTMSP